MLDHNTRYGHSNVMNSPFTSMVIRTLKVNLLGQMHCKASDCSSESEGSVARICLQFMTQSCGGSDQLSTVVDSLPPGTLALCCLALKPIHFNTSIQWRIQRLDSGEGDPVQGNANVREYICCGENCISGNLSRWHLECLSNSLFSFAAKWGPTEWVLGDTPTSSDEFIKSGTRVELSDDFTPSREYGD